MVDVVDVETAADDGSFSGGEGLLSLEYIIII